MIFTPLIAVDSDKVDGAHASATPTSSTVPIADVNGKLDGWVTANITDHGALTGLADDDHTQYIKHSLATALSDFLVASGAGAFVKKTLAEVKTILGLGSAAYTDSTAYLPTSNPTVTGTLTLGADLKSGSAGANALTYTANGGHTFVGPVTVGGRELGTWTSYTPSTGGITVGNGTIVASYSIVNKLVFGSILFTLGTTSAITGDVYFTLPITLVSNQSGVASCIDAGVRGYDAFVDFSATAAYVRIKSLINSYISSANLSSTVPHTWGATDNISVRFMYGI